VCKWIFNDVFSSLRLRKSKQTRSALKNLSLFRLPQNKSQSFGLKWFGWESSLFDFRHLNNWLRYGFNSVMRSLFVILIALFLVHTHLFIIRAIYSTHAVRCRIKCQRFGNYIAFPMGLFVRIGTSLFGFVLKFWVSPRKRAIEFYEYVFAIMVSSFCLYWQNRLVSC